MKAIKLKNNIYWVGAVDSQLRLFHGYSTDTGSTYNAYLIIDKQITLIDTVKKPFFSEMLSRIKSVIDPGKIDNIILNHVEPDHSGAITDILALCKNAVVYASAGSGVNGIKNYHGIECKPIKTNDCLNFGKYNLQFIQTPMLHWPDNMVAYLKEENILFSNDAFGQHYATHKILDTENDISEVLYQAKKYYANIVMPYNIQVKKAISDVSPLEIDTIAPSHGVVLTKYKNDVLKLYSDIADENNKNKAVVIYDTMWHSTEKIATAIAEGFVEKDYDIKIMSLQNNHISDIITEITDCKYIAVGSPTLNNNILPTVASFLTYLKGLAPKNKQFIAFGSYGWGGQSVGQIQDVLTSLKYQPLLDKVSCQFKPSDEFLHKVTDSVKLAVK